MPKGRGAGARCDVVVASWPACGPASPAAEPVPGVPLAPAGRERHAGVLRPPGRSAAHRRERLRLRQPGARTASNYKLRRTPKKRDEWDVTLLILRHSRRTHSGQLHPLPVRRQLPVAPPMPSGLLRPPEFLERHGEIEVRLGVVGVEPQGRLVRGARLLQPARDRGRRCPC